MKKIILLKITAALLFLKLLTVLFVCLLYLPAHADNIITSGTSLVLSPGTRLVSTDHLVIKNGATVSNSGTLYLQKNLSNENASANSLGNGTVQISGSTAQTLNGQNIIQNLTMNNSTGLSLGGNTTVNGTLTLTSGRLNLGNYNLFLGNSASVSGTPSASKMIVATGTGELRKGFTSGFTGSFTFPVGDATGTAEYSPVVLTISGGTFSTGNYIGVKLTNDAYPGQTGSYIKRYWVLSQQAITSLQCEAVFQYVLADVVGTESELYCLRVQPTPQSVYSPANTTLHQLFAQGLTSFGTFTGGIGIISDIINLLAGWNLISFDVSLDPNTPALVFAPLITAGNLLMVTAYQGQQGKFFDPNGPPFLNTLLNLADGEGYWVKVQNAATLTKEGIPIPPGFTINLLTGWNLIAYWPQNTTTPAAAFASLISAGKLVIVTGYEGGGKFYDPNGPPFLNTLTEINNGFGYWVKVNSNYTFTYPQ